MEKNFLSRSLTLPCGAVLNNRLAKAAMTERISDKQLHPTAAHERLYRDWADTGAGLLITGNVLIDAQHLESAGNVCVTDASVLPKLRRWAEAGKGHGNHIWVQLSHAGRQTNRFTNMRPLAPSAVQLHKMGLFGKPRAMSEADITAVVAGFARAAGLAKAAGFTGVQVHAAHGYLLSQFLSPVANVRTDQWGGSIANRSRLLLEVVSAVRAAVGDEFPIGVKLNSSDFRRGGFTEEESLEVVKLLDLASIDLLEISGGTYEKVAFFLMNEEQTAQNSSGQLAKEAYFMAFAKRVRAVSRVPLMVTGGFRSYDFCNGALESGELDLIGMGRPFITNRDDIAGFLEGKVTKLENLVLRTGARALEDAAEGGFYARQIIRLAAGKGIRLNMSALWCSVFLVWHELSKSLARRF